MKTLITAAALALGLATGLATAACAGGAAGAAVLLIIIGTRPESHLMLAQLADRGGDGVIWLGHRRYTD